MLVFPNCKINLGLHVINKRTDGYHDIETVFYPVNWCDALEIIENREDARPFVFSQSGLTVNGSPENNLIYRAWQLMAEQKKCRPVKVHLHKNIPMGAGLGGGSADAAFFIKLLNRQLDLGYTEEEKTGLARRLGSDCAFFTRNRTVFAGGKGDELEELQLDLSNYYILVVYPGIHSNTAEAYGGLTPKQPELDLQSFLTTHPVSGWKNRLTNDFEPVIFKKYPEIKETKERLYQAGALYASMSGSGSAVFGIFNSEPFIQWPKDYSFCLQKPLSKIL